MRSWTRPSALAIVVVMSVVSCASPQTGGADRTASGSSQQPTPKRAVAAMHGNPKAILYSLNSGGGGRTDGAYELQGLVNSGMGIQSTNGGWQPALAENLPSID